MSVSATILTQMGGQRRLSVMTGAYGFIDHGDGVSFKFKNRKSSRGNHVKVTLDKSDTYTVEFSSIRGLNFRVVKELHGIYASALKDVFEKQTGLLLTLESRGPTLNQLREGNVYIDDKTLIDMVKRLSKGTRPVSIKRLARELSVSEKLMGDNLMRLYRDGRLRRIDYWLP